MKRNILEKLEIWKNSKNRKPLLLKGARQVGKTYILKEFGKGFFPRYHYINFEENPNIIKIFNDDLNPSRIIQELNFFLKENIDQNNDLLIFKSISVFFN